MGFESLMLKDIFFPATRGYTGVLDQNTLPRDVCHVRGFRSCRQRRIRCMHEPQCRKSQGNQNEERSPFCVWGSAKFHDREILKLYFITY